MAVATSPATSQAYGVKRVCTIWDVARSSFYAARRQDARPAKRPAGRRGPSPAVSDAELLVAIRPNAMARCVLPTPGPKSSSAASPGPGAAFDRVGQTGKEIILEQRLIPLAPAARNVVTAAV